MNKASWRAQALLAAIFLFAAGMKMFAFNAMAARVSGIGHMRTEFTLIACCDIADAFGVILPRLTAIMPWPTPLATFGLAPVVLAAGLFHMARQECAELSFTLILMLFALFVAGARGPGKARLKGRGFKP